MGTPMSEEQTRWAVAGFALVAAVVVAFVVALAVLGPDDPPCFRDAREPRGPVYCPEPLHGGER
jgi:hypothetical protein